MKKRTEVVSGKKRIIIIREASGIDKVKEAVLMVMGPEKYEYRNETEE